MFSKIKELAKKSKERLLNKNKNNNVVLMDLTEERELEERIYDILRKDIYTPNPIGQLVDQKKFLAMNEPDREYYLFKIIDKYTEIRHKFLNS